MTLPQTMIGAVLTGPETIDIRDLPVERPGPGEILLSIEAATTCGTDVKVFKRGGHPRMLKVPTVFGHEFSGHIAAVGLGVQNLKEGDAVVVANSAPCGDCTYCTLERENLCEDLAYINGAFAEFICIPARFVKCNMHAIPDGLSFARAALTEPLACVLHGMDACDLDRYAALGPVETVVFGGGPIGLLFIAALARSGHAPVLADPNEPRLAAGRSMGAAKTVQIKRGGGQAEIVKAAADHSEGTWVAIDASGVPEVWVDAINCIRPGGLVNLFGGCAPGTSIPLDTHRLHYSELNVKGVYHHRPDTVRRALEMLSDPAFPADVLLSATVPIEKTEAALRSMIDKCALKVVISGRAH